MNDIVALDNGIISTDFKQTYVDLDAEKKALEKALKDIKAKIAELDGILMEAMNESDLRVVETDDIRVLVTPAKPFDYEEEFDIDTFKSEHFELYNQYAHVKAKASKSKITVTCRCNKKGTK